MDLEARTLVGSIHRAFKVTKQILVLQSYGKAHQGAEP